MLEQRAGYLAIRVTGRDAERAFAHEAGGHRWQRVPPTERRGRVHTSTITVAVLKEPTEAQVRLDPGELVISKCRGSGAGGQHRNVTDSAVQVKHVPTGLIVRAEGERSQHQNRALALALLRAKLQEGAASEASAQRNRKRKRQIGGGARGDKRRTIAVQRGEVVDHLTGKRLSMKRYLRGELQGLWP